MDLHAAFEATVHDDATLRSHRLSKLSTSGRITAQDPLTRSAPEPFAVEFPPGRHLVELLLATTRGDTRVALARVRFGGAPPVRHELALRAGQDVRALAPGQTFGYGVDAGMGCFMEPGLDGAIGDDVLGELDRTSSPTWTHAARVPDGDGHRVVMFSSGFGDGVYATFIGRDASGAVVELVTDFGVLELDLPAVADDRAFRAAHARRTWEQLVALLPGVRRGGSEHAAAYGHLAELSSSPDDALGVLDEIWEASTRADDAVTRDLFDALLQRLLRSPRVQDASLPRIDLTAPESARWLSRIARRAVGPRTAEAWLAGFDGAHPSTKLHILTTLDDGPGCRALLVRALDDDALAEEALQRLAGSRPPEPLGEDAIAKVERLAADATEPRARSHAMRLLDALGRLPESALAHEDPRQRLAAAGALARRRANAARVDPVLVALADDVSLEMDERLSAATQIQDEHAKVDALVRVGLAGHPAAAIQLRYVCTEGALAGLERLARESQSQTIRVDAKTWIARTRKLVDAKRG